MADHDFKFQKIYEDFRPKIIRYLTRMVGESEAEDLTQEVFTKIGQALKTFRGESQLSTWVYQIATHAALDRRTDSLHRAASYPQGNERLHPGDDRKSSGKLPGRPCPQRVGGAERQRNCRHPRIDPSYG